MRYVIAFGGNLGDLQQTFAAAFEMIEERIGEIAARSPRYWTKPLLHPTTPSLGQQPHMNGVIAVTSDLEPQQVLDELMIIEQHLGRVRASELVPWGPRVIDLDIVTIEQEVINTDKLTVPHPEMHKRDFVLVPMLAVCPEWQHPLLQKSTKELEAELQERSIISEEPAEQEARS